MEMFKVFPPLLMDLITKILPGALIVFLFKYPPYLPPNDYILGIWNLKGDFYTFGQFAVAAATAYAIGVFVAIFANVVDSILIKRVWYPRMSADPGSFIFVDDEPPQLRAALLDRAKFLLFIDHCRVVVATKNPSYAITLEKYRTAYRVFFGLTLISIGFPIFEQTLISTSLLLGVLPFGVLSLHISKKYLLKSMQLCSMANAERPQSTC
jgi:hypothetical protein